MINLRQRLIIKLRSAHQFCQTCSRFQSGAPMAFQKMLYFLIRAQISILTPLDLLPDQESLGVQFLHLFLRDQANPIPLFPQTQIRVVLTQQQSVLCSGGHHAVGFSVVLGHQIVNQHADITFPAIQHQGLFVQNLHSSVDSGDQSLTGRLLVTAASV